MKSVRLLCSLLLCLLAPLSARAEITIVGSSTILPVIRDLAPLFTENTGIRVNVSGGGSDAGITGATTGRADIGMVSRALLPGEVGKLEVRNIGHDGIAVIVNHANPVSGLTSEQVREMFARRIEKWPAFGWRGGGDVVPVIKSAGRSTRLLFDQKFGVGNIIRAGTHEVGANLAMVLFVAADPQAVGYVSIGTVSEATRRGVKIKALMIDDVAPTVQNCSAGRYNLCRPLLLVMRRPLRAEVLQFLDFAAGQMAAEIVRKHGFEPALATP